MKSFFLKKFQKHYKKRIQPHKALDEKFRKRYLLFIQDQTNPILEDHQLKRDLKGYRAFSITGDLRAIYYIKNDIAFFVDIGTHNQVYGG